jgi:hypothetical protein
VYFSCENLGFGLLIEIADVTQNDAAGDLYVRCDGKDSGLADLAIACHLDLEYGNVSMKSGLAVFSALAHDNLACGLVVIGCLSGHGDPQGEDYLKADCFSSHSAVFEIREFEREELRLEGSPLLISKAKKYVGSGMSINASVSRSTKPVFIRIEGPSSEQVAISTLREYSRYIAALFENFD